MDDAELPLSREALSSLLWDDWLLDWCLYSSWNWQPPLPKMILLLLGTNMLLMIIDYVIWCLLHHLIYTFAYNNGVDIINSISSFPIFVAFVLGFVAIAGTRF